jgi:acetylornithine deacetylase/succinyl-diaminopimelate desuccinylase-like protein
VHGGRLPLNLKFLIEGEEEIGGASISKFVAENRAKLKADVALVSDTQLYAEGLPTLCIGLRGLVYMEVEATGPDRDLHSGLYGGAAPNPIWGLIELLSKCKDATGSIRIPGMYDDVAPPAPVERESWKALPFDEGEFLRKEVGASELTGEAGYSVLERVWARPTMEVHGVAGGFTGVGSKTVIPSKAVAKVSFRLVPKQDPGKILKSFGEFLQHNAPGGIRIQLRVLSAAPAVLVDPDHPAIRIAAKAFSDVLGKPTVFTRNGGSIPVVGDFATHLGVPTILMGFGLPDDGLHSPNEKYKIDNYYTGIMTIAHFFEQYGAQAATEPRP